MLRGPLVPDRSRHHDRVPERRGVERPGAFADHRPAAVIDHLLEEQAAARPLRAGRRRRSRRDARARRSDAHRARRTAVAIWRAPARLRSVPRRQPNKHINRTQEHVDLLALGTTEVGGPAYGRPAFRVELDYRVPGAEGPAGGGACDHPGPAEHDRGRSTSRDVLEPRATGGDERHHRPELGTDGLDRVGLARSPKLVELGDGRHGPLPPTPSRSCRL